MNESVEIDARRSVVEFDALLAEEIDALPVWVRVRLDVPIWTEAEPPQEMRALAGVGEAETIYGVFSRSAVDGLRCIVLYRGPILRRGGDLRVAIRETLRHEVGHFFGLTEEQIERL